MWALTGNRRAARIGVVAAIGTAMLAVGIGAPATVTAAAACGTGASRPCPVVERLDPSLFQGAPRGPVTVRIVGSVLDGVAVVVLEPAGKVVQISGRDAGSISIVIPAGTLTIGSTARFGLRLAGQDADAVVSQPIAVIEPGAVNPGPSLAPAPVAVDTHPTSAVGAQPAAPVVPAPRVPSGAGVGRVLLFLLVGFALGAWGVYLIAERTGLLYEVQWCRDRRDQREHGRALQQIDCHLSTLWEGGGDVVIAGRRLDAAAEERAGIARPSRQQLEAVRAALIADFIAGRSAVARNLPRLSGLGVPASMSASREGALAAVPVTVSGVATGIPGTAAPPWSIREQSKPLGAPPRSRTSPD